MRRLVTAVLAGGLGAGFLGPVAGVGAAAATGATTPVSADWKQPGFDQTHTRFNAGESTIGAASVASLTLAWAKAPDQTLPMVEHGKVLTCASGSCYSRVLATGAQQWRVGRRTHAVSTTIGADQMYVTDRLRRVGGIDLGTGQPTVAISGAYVANVPVTFDSGRVFMTGFHGHLTASDAVTGTLVWSSAKAFALGADVLSSPTVAGSRVYASGCGVLTSLLIAYREDNGRYRWSAPLPGQPGECGGLPAASGAAVYVTTSAVTSIDGLTGTKLWTAAGDGGRLSDPAVAYGLVYAVSATAGTLAAYDVTTGARVWTADTSGTGSPSVANGVVYVSGPTALQAFDAATGAPLATITGDLRGDPVIADGALLINCDDPAVGVGVCVYRP
jgi:outer membrane protein assembly factor BamB